MAPGYTTVAVSAGAIIKQRADAVLSPCPETSAFASESLRRDMEKYDRYAQGSGWVLFDRGAVAALAMVDEASGLEPGELQVMLQQHPFHRSAFVLPAWQSIDTADAVRAQAFEEARLRARQRRHLTW